MLRPPDVNNECKPPAYARRKCVSARARFRRIFAASPATGDGRGDREETTMAIKLINIGFGNIVSANRIISIVRSGIGADQADHPGTPGTATC